MPLNKQKGNMYGFVTHTWNTIKGACPHDCSYCYCKSMAQRFNKPQPELHFDEKELKTNLGSGNFIFVGSSCDMFADNIPEEWIRKTLEHCGKYQHNKYLFQTKNPGNIRRIMLMNTTCCVTIETNRENDLNNSPTRYDRFIDSLSIRNDVMITIEPIMDFDIRYFIRWLQDLNPIQVNIGANTNRKVRVPEPPKEKVLDLITELEKFTTVHVKKNLDRIIK